MLHPVPITRVVVHPDGALVTREGRIAVVDQAVAIRGLPLLLDPTSVRVSLGGAPIRQVRVELDFEGQDRGPDPEVLQDWTAARDALVALDATLDAARRERDTLARIAPAYDEDPRRPVPTADRWMRWTEAEQAIGERVAGVDQELRALERSRRDGVERIAILAARVEQASTQTWWRRWQPTRRVRIEAGGAEEVDVELSYRVPGARWSPVYTLDADGGLHGGRFSIRATVVQATGEDWEQVEVALTSAPSTRRIDVPELAALRLGSRAPSARVGWRPLPDDLEALFPQGAAAPSPVAEPAPPAERYSGPADKTVTTFSDEEPNGEDEDEEYEYEEDDDITVDLVHALAPDEPMTRRRGAFADAPSAAVGVVGGFVGELMDDLRAAPKGGRARSAAPSAQPQSASSSLGGGGPPPPPPAPLEQADDWLDYGRLRLMSAEAGWGRRGRLQPITDADWLGERRAPAEARSRLSEWIETRSSAARRVTDGPLPPHHVLPGPIGGSDVRIDAAGRIDLPSDGDPHTIAVQGWPVELGVAYRAVPRHDPRVFRRVTARVPYDRPLLPGPVEVYVDGRLELTSAWAGSAGRGTLLLGLGAEDRLKLVRNVRYREESAGMFGGSRRMHTTIEVQIASSLPRPVTVELLERLPVPLEDSGMAVELAEAQPPTHPYTGEPDGAILKGGRRQTVQVGPGAEARAVLGYTVTVQNRDELVGGDRRG